MAASGRTLKNWELQRGYAAELRAILEALKRGEE
jgi:hypothetical protein